MVVRSDVLHPGHPVQHVIYRAANIAVHRSCYCPKHTGRGLLRHLRALRGMQLSAAGSISIQKTVFVCR